MTIKIQLSFQQMEQHKIKNSYKFHVDSTCELTAPNDWYNSYLEIDVEVNKKADGTTYAAADNTTFASDA